MTFDQWYTFGVEQGWIARVDGHPEFVFADHPASHAPVLSEWGCNAHSDGQSCCADHPEVVRVRSYPYVDEG